MKNTNQNLPKWLCTAGAFFFCLFLECCLFSRLPVKGAVPVLVPLTAAAAGFLEGPWEGAVFGLCAGTVWAALCGQARAIWLLALIGQLCGMTLHRTLGRTFPGYLLCAAGVLALWELGQALPALALHREQGRALLAIALREGGYSLAFVPLVYLLFYAIHRRFRPGLEFESP